MTNTATPKGLRLVRPWDQRLWNIELGFDQPTPAPTLGECMYREVFEALVRGLRARREVSPASTVWMTRELVYSNHPLNGKIAVAHDKAVTFEPPQNQDGSKVWTVIFFIDPMPFALWSHTAYYAVVTFSRNAQLVTLEKRCMPPAGATTSGHKPLWIDVSRRFRGVFLSVRTRS